MNRNLFPNTEQASRDRAAAVRARNLLNNINRELRYPVADTASRVQQLGRELESTVRGIRGAQGPAMAVAQAASGLQSLLTGGEQSFVRRVLSSIGRGLLDRWLQSGEGQRSMQSARDQVRQLGSLVDQVEATLDASERQAQERALQSVAVRADRQARRSENSGAGASGSSGSSGPGTRPPVERVDRQPAASPPNSGLPSSVQILPDGSWDIRTGSIRRVYRPDDPKITGEMVPVRSSNLHSIGMELNFRNLAKSTLFVRFKVKGRSGGGTYAVYDVWPELFDDLLAAPSKGSEYWSRVRIRGTVSGSQYRYALIRADIIRGQAYLPRRAITTPGGIQRLVRRERTALHSNGRTEIVRSPRPNETLGRYRPGAHAPNIGNPRGGMDRGNPPRGPELRR